MGLLTCFNRNLGVASESRGYEKKGCSDVSFWQYQALAIPPTEWEKMLEKASSLRWPFSGSLYLLLNR
jgi:hypothetical protein